MDMGAAMNLFPGSGSPSSISGMSPPANGEMSCSSSCWLQQNVPTLHLPGSNLQSSRLRSSLSARDIPPKDLLSDYDKQQQHLLDDLAIFSQTRSNPLSLSRSARTKTLTPNLEDLFCSEIASSPRYCDQAVAAFSPTHNKSVLLNQFQLQQQSVLAPINTCNVYSCKSLEHPILQASLGVSSPISVEPITPITARLSAFAFREKQQQMHSLSSRDLDLGTKHTSSLVGSPVESWSNRGSLNGKVDWSVNGGERDELGQLRGSSSVEHGSNGEGPHLSWIQSLVKESPPEKREKLVTLASSAAPLDESLATQASVDSVDHSVIAAWIEQMQLDQLVAQ